MNDPTANYMLYILYASCISITAIVHKYCAHVHGNLLYRDKVISETHRYYSVSIFCTLQVIRQSITKM